MWKSQISPTTEFAGFWIRLAAFLIDIILLGVVFWVFNGVWGVASGAGWMERPTDDPFTQATGAPWLVGSLFLFFIIIVYLVCFWGWRGQTVGKMLLRIKIIRIDGSELGWGVAAIRFLSYIISFLLAFIGYFWVAFDQYKQGLHDKMADTYVIRVPRK